jgi:hypothetical protein
MRHSLFAMRFGRKPLESTTRHLSPGQLV